MALTGKSTLSLRKKDVLEQKRAGTAYKRLVFAHKATLGDTGIDLTALSQPSEMASLGFTNPNVQEILAAKLLFHKQNLTVISSVKGVLIQDLSYTVPTSTRIAFQGFTAEDGEIFTCILESSVRDGLQVVHANPIVVTGTLPAGQTTFVVGTPFEVNKYPNGQVGSILVFLDGIQQFRNTGNSDVTLDANYYEVDVGSGLGNVIEFNTADPVNDRSVLVVSNGLLTEKPYGSQQAEIESLAGQVDAMIPTLAVLAGVPESTFQSAPNSVDLKSFGDLVQSILDVEVPIITEWQSYTPTITAQSGSLTNFTLSNTAYKRVGSELYMQGSLQFTGSPGTWSYPQVSLPSGLTLLSGVTLRGRVLTSNPSNVWEIEVTNGISSDRIRFTSSGTTTDAFTAHSNTFPFTYASGDSISWFVGPIRVNEWTNSTETIRQKLGL